MECSEIERRTIPVEEEEEDLNIDDFKSKPPDKSQVFQLVKMYKTRCKRNLKVSIYALIKTNFNSGYLYIYRYVNISWILTYAIRVYPLWSAPK
jgi:hypothetical protein